MTFETLSQILYQPLLIIGHLSFFYFVILFAFKFMDKFILKIIEKF